MSEMNAAPVMPSLNEPAPDFQPLRTKDITQRTNLIQADTVQTAIRMLDLGQRSGSVAHWLHKRGVSFDTAWRVILAPEMRRTA